MWIEKVTYSKRDLYTVSYLSKGTGDLYIKGSCQNIESSNVTIGDYLYVPKLDGTENFTQLDETTTIANGELSGGRGYLTQSWDNSGDWELSCQVKWSNQNCGIELYPLGATDESNICGATAWTKNTIWYNNGSFNELRENFGVNWVYGSWYNATFRKQNGVLTVIIDNLTRTISTWNALTSATSMHIGVGSWTGTTTIKNIKVKPL